eukprot:INCI18072.1.p1 GENE.INCI18072.1~~INCI18072.1.p1  ORF type:complete len:447 (+),score=74.56 INCI18072.1:248-1588(+)
MMLYPPQALTLRSRGIVTNPRANAVVDIAKERHARALAKAAADRSLSTDELRKVHNYVDLLRQDWDREQGGLLPLMTEGSSEEGQSDAADSENGAKRNSAATSSITKLGQPSLGGSSSSNEWQSHQQGSDSDDGEMKQNGTSRQVDSEGHQPRQPERAAHGPESTRATGPLASWWEQVPCLAHASEIGIDNNKLDPSFISAAERKFLHRMSTARSSPHRRKQDHRVYDWAPPVRRPMSTHNRKKSYAQRTQRRSSVNRGQSRPNSTTIQTTAAWEMKKATNPAAVAAEVALAAMKREAAIVAASARKAAPASPHATKAAAVLKAVEDAQARVAAEALKRERRSPGDRKSCSRPPLPATQRPADRRRKVEPQTRLQQDLSRCLTNAHRTTTIKNDNSRSAAQGSIDDASGDTDSGSVVVSVDLDGTQNPLVRLVAAIQKRAVGADKS